MVAYFPFRTDNYKSRNIVPDTATGKIERVVNFLKIFKRFLGGFRENNAVNYKSEY
jgi:hypothetical protein